MCRPVPLRSAGGYYQAGLSAYQVWAYHPDKAGSLIEDYLLGDDPRPDLALGGIVGEEGFRGNSPPWGDDPAYSEQQRVILQTAAISILRISMNI